MSADIYLAALLVRDGRVLLTRPRPDAAWELPGTSFREGLTDVDDAMAYHLASAGIRARGIPEAFVQTLHLPRGEGHVVYNLYAPEDWEGELRTEPGTGSGWYTPDELASISMDAAVRDTLLALFGVAPPVDDDASVLAAIDANLPGAAAGSRHERGLDVLRTLSGGDPALSYRGLGARSPELAGDIVDFALGEVWATAPLDRRTRSLQVVAMLAALGRPNALRSHIGGALNHGATPEQVVETLRMVAVYGGFPAAIEAWPIMEAVFAERGIPRPGGAP